MFSVKTGKMDMRLSCGSLPGFFIRCAPYIYGFFSFSFFLPGFIGINFPFSFLLATPYRYEITPAAAHAYELVTSLRFNQAQLLLAQMKTGDPGNLIALHLENYQDCLAVYISEDETAFQRLKKKKSERMGLLQQCDPDSPYYRFAQADVRLQWAMAHLKFGEYFSAFSEVSKAHKLLRQNQERFPAFLPNQKDLALLHAVAGVIPDNFKWGMKMLTGLEGSIDQGRREMEQVLRKAHGTDFLFETETRVFYAFLLLHLANDGEAAWQAVVTGQLQPAQNPVHCFITANIAMRTGRNDKAIALLEKCPRGGPFASLPFIDQMLGMAKLRRLDGDAGQFFSRFLQHYKGRNFIKEAYQKLAWHALIQGDEKGYRQYMERCIAQGHTTSGSDRSALREARSGEAPHPVLLRARLLFDGGYFQKALQLMQTQPQAGFSNERHRVEYAYRMGRILQALNQFDEAMKYYRSALWQGTAQGYFFACNACLQIGLIYEKRSQKDKAREYFQRCLSLESDEYETELHQKAKAGLNRLKN